MTTLIGGPLQSLTSNDRGIGNVQLWVVKNNYYGDILQKSKGLKKFSGQKNQWVNKFRGEGQIFLFNDLHSTTIEDLKKAKQMLPLNFHNTPPP